MLVLATYEQSNVALPRSWLETTRVSSEVLQYLHPVIRVSSHVLNHTNHRRQGGGLAVSQTNSEKEDKFSLAPYLAGLPVVCQHCDLKSGSTNEGSRKCEHGLSRASADPDQDAAHTQPNTAEDSDSNTWQGQGVYDTIRLAREPEVPEKHLGRSYEHKEEQPFDKRPQGAWPWVGQW